MNNLLDLISRKLNSMFNFNLKKTISKLNEAKAKDEFKSKTEKRLRFYTLLHDYINSPGSGAPDSFFETYLLSLDRRAQKFPDWVKWIAKQMKSENEANLRSFLRICHQRHLIGDTFLDIIKPWLPEDEFRLLKASRSSDISEALSIVIDICHEKISARELVMSSVMKNIPLLMVAGIVHWVLFQFLYSTFVNEYNIQTYDSFSSLTWLEQNYIRYIWLYNYWWVVVGGVVATYFAFKLSMEHWHKKGVYIREQFVDYIPPYSLYKLTQQYQLILIVSSFMRSGASFSSALEQAREGAKPFVKMQINRILSDSATKAHIAFNIPFLGDAGNQIEERAKYVSLKKAMTSLLPRLQQEKKEKFEKGIGFMTLITVKPMVYGSLVYSFIPIVIELKSYIPET